MFCTFSMDIDEGGEDVQNFLITLREVDALKPKLRQSYVKLWMQEQLHIDHSLLWYKVHILFLGFPTSYLVERGSVQCDFCLENKRQRLRIHERGDFCMYK